MSDMNKLRVGKEKSQIKYTLIILYVQMRGLQKH